ncbi:MAG TPA: PilZ domain-containing protein [Planctomycetota bacterium]|nr:PilZ domain-containing protein [Planctomycetota bacterium]
MKPQEIKVPTLMADRISLDDSGLKGYIRRWTRKNLRVPTKVKLLLDGRKGRVYTTGTAVVGNISFTGALLREIKLKSRSLPTERFTLRLDFDLKEYKGIGAIARPVHFGHGKKFELGVEFIDLWVGKG